MNFAVRKVLPALVIFTFNIVHVCALPSTSSTSSSTTTTTSTISSTSLQNVAAESNNSTSTTTSAISTATIAYYSKNTVLPDGAFFASVDTTIPNNNVSDYGYANGSPQAGSFINGWYQGIFWRTVGDPPFIAGAPSIANAQHLTLREDRRERNLLNLTENNFKQDILRRRSNSSNGSVNNDYFYSTQGLDQGYPDSRMMLTISNTTMFCRALLAGATPQTITTPTNVPVACVRFNVTSGAVISATYLEGILGNFSAYVVRRLVLQTPISLSVQGFECTGNADANDEFPSGWYDGVFWRVCGEYPDMFVAGGVVENQFLYNTAGLDQGLTGTRVIATVVGSDPMFCRGVGTTDANSYMACVLFDQSRVVNEYFLYQQLGTWSLYSNS
ncbi:hypothetical protein HK100_011973 [Physocladia obscura]|uniref:Uncharacterized protein n=1 Tax=Physocladia obscura TaxID=109957 RepID=A0AAD5XG94_9FUNG|nr:hypothetical protein HK100_011973 [Physocladia obscura]